MPKHLDEERVERIYQRSLKIKDFSDDSRRTVAKTGRMCTETVQKEFLSKNELAKWTPKELWDHLQIRNTLQNWASKWNTLGKLHSIHQRDCAEFISKIRDIKLEINDLKITMDEAITIHTLNSLDTQFKSYLAILNHESREKAELPTLEVSAKALEDEELRLANQDKATANYMQKEKKGGGDSDKKKKPGENSNSNNSTDSKTHMSAPDVRKHIEKVIAGWKRWNVTDVENTVTSRSSVKRTRRTRKARRPPPT